MENNFDYELQLAFIAEGLSEEIWEFSEVLDDTPEENELVEFFL